MVRKHHKGREVFVFAAKTVTDPAAHAGKSRQLESSGLEIGRLTVNACLSDQIVDEGHVVHHRCQIRDDFAQRVSALPVSLEFPDGLQPGPKSILKRLHRLAKITLLSVPLHQFLFEIEEIQMAGGTRHEELDDALRPRGMLPTADQGRVPCPLDRGTQKTFLLKKACQRESSQSATGSPEKLTPGSGAGPKGLPVKWRCALHERQTR